MGLPPVTLQKPQTWCPKSGVWGAEGMPPAGITPQVATRTRSVATVPVLAASVALTGGRPPALSGTTPWPTSMAIALSRKHSTSRRSIVTFARSSCGVSWAKDTFAKVKTLLSLSLIFLPFHVRKLLSFSLLQDNFFSLHFFLLSLEICCALSSERERKLLDSRSFVNGGKKREKKALSYN